VLFRSSSTSQVSGEVGIADSRVDRLTSFFRNYNSPLANYSQEIVQAADENNFDFRYLPAIAAQESQWCKKIPANSYNCWGYGITSKKTIRFSSYSEAINTVSKALGKYYISRGLTNLEEIGHNWNPANNNDWLEKVNYFLKQI